MAAGALSPEQQGSALQQALNVNAQPFDNYYKAALAMQALTPRQPAPRNLATKVIPIGGKNHTVLMDPTTGEIMKDFGENPKDSTEPNVMVRSDYPINGEAMTVILDPKTGRLMDIIGPTPKAEGDPAVKEARYFRIETGIRNSLMQEMSQEGYGKLIQTPDGGTTIKWDNPSQAIPAFTKRLVERLEFEKKQGRLPQDWFIPGQGSSQIDDQPQTIQIGGQELPLIPIQTIEQARRLPEGSYFIAPDGSIGQVKNGKAIQVGG